MLNASVAHLRVKDHAVEAVATPQIGLDEANLPLIDRESTKIAQQVVDLLERHSVPGAQLLPLKLAKNVNREHAEKLTFGQHLADRIAATMGSWCFIALQSLFIIGWIVANSIPAFPHWDANPFILLNLVMAFQAAYAAPVIMMSQNRQSAKDHLAAEIDHEVNLQNAAQLQEIIKRLDQIEANVPSKRKQGVRQSR